MVLSCCNEITATYVPYVTFLLGHCWCVCLLRTGSCLVEIVIYECGSVWEPREEREEEKCLDRRGKTGPKRMVDGVSAFSGSAVEQIANCETSLAVFHWNLSRAHLKESPGTSWIWVILGGSESKSAFPSRCLTDCSQNGLTGWSRDSEFALKAEQHLKPSLLVTPTTR